MNSDLTAPVVLFVFNRPDVTTRVFEAIRSAKPTRLFLVADAPRNDGDRAKCDEVKSIIEKVDWPCDVKRNYSEVNMGCDPRVASGIEWVFEHADRAIFLEDDCLPHPSFFRFCSDLLSKYENDTDVMHISGDNFQKGNKKFICNESYYFSTIAQSWGWATWKRAWERYDKDMIAWPQVKREGQFEKIFGNKAQAEYWETLFQKFYDKKRINWDGRWTFACFRTGGLSIMPKVNLISNIGFGGSATHTTQAGHKFANLPTYEMEFPLVHPKNRSINKNADSYTMKQVFGVNENFKQWVKWKLKSLFPKPYQYAKNLFHKTS